MGEPHAASKELYDKVSSWYDCPIPFSKHFGWERWGLLGALSHYVLTYVPGDIIEIGVCESSIFFTKLAKQFNRKVYHCDIQGSIYANCLTVDGYFDSEKNLLFIGSSDDFFKNTEFTPIALGFIDGDHIYDQVKRDFDNLYKLLVERGFIFLHDTYPPNEEWLGPSACGTVYLLRRELEQRKDMQIFTFDRSAIEVGLSMVQKLPLVRSECRT